jgi:hypothetical protein
MCTRRVAPSLVNEGEQQRGEGKRGEHERAEEQVPATNSPKLVP